VQVQGPQGRCGHCRGAGTAKRLTCTACGGKGLVPLPLGAPVVCLGGQATGDDFSASAIPCLKCRGRGWVIEDAEKGMGEAEAYALNGEHTSFWDCSYARRC
jgi:RecJ-like exonuclease